MYSYLLELIKELSLQNLFTLATSIVHVLAMTNISYDLNIAHLCANAAKVCHESSYLHLLVKPSYSLRRLYNSVNFTPYRRFMVIVVSYFRACKPQDHQYCFGSSNILQKIRIKRLNDASEIFLTINPLRLLGLAAQQMCVSILTATSPHSLFDFSLFHFVSALNK